MRWPRSASEKSAASRNPREVAPGRWTVILEPAAVLDLVGFLFYDFAGTAVLDQRSCFNKRMGKKLMGENITLHDDVIIRCNPARRSTAKASRGRKFCWWISGVPNNLVYRARHRQENESQAHRPRLSAAQ